MSPGPTFDALGFRFTVACSDTEMLRHVSALFAGLAIPPDDDATEFALDAEPESMSESLVALVGTVNMRATGAAEESLLLHAGGLCRRDGGAAIVCGPSGSGKSTLTAALGVRGYAYLSDETVCLTPNTLHITPFRKPLSLKRGAHSVLPHLRPESGSIAERCSKHQWLIPPDALGGAPPPNEPLVPAIIVFPTHTPGAATRIEPVATAEAAYVLGGNTWRLSWVRGSGLHALARLSRRAPAYRLVYDDVHRAADAVEDLWNEVA